MAGDAGDRQEIRSRLAEVVGEANVSHGEEVASYSAAGELPAAVVRPADEREAAEVATLARERLLPVVPWGGGSKQDLEPVQPRGGIVLQTARLGSIVELDAPNLTVTVGAGIVVDHLQRELAKHALFLPLDPVDSDRSTIGGTLATNSSGPNRLLYRTARDFVLGMRVVTPRGEAIKAGGKTVKDVAGYDLKKLYIGSWGTLGLVTEATFRLLPLPETRSTVAMLFPDLSSAAVATSSLLSSFLRPSAAELLTSSMVPGPLLGAPRPNDGEHLLLVQVEGAREVVDRHRTDLLDLATRGGATAAEAIGGEAERQLWRQRKQLFSTIKNGKGYVLLKASVPIKRLFDFMAVLPPVAETAGAEFSVAAHAGNGIAHLLLETQLDALARLVPAVEQIQRAAGESSGFAMVQRAHREISNKLAIWPSRDDYGLMREIRAQLDPNDLWNPARVPGGRAQ